MEKKRLLSLDVIKGIAMLMVILVHFEQNFHLCSLFNYFQMGCPIFFVASGFNIMCLVHRHFDGCTNRQSIRAFYISRYKALMPAWYLAFFIIFTVNTLTLSISGRTLSFGTNRDPLSILCNLLFLHGFLPFCINNVMPGGWYIGTTVILYGITPLILFAIQKFRSRKCFFLLSSVFCMLPWFALMCIYADRFLKTDFSYFSFPVHYPNYLLGVLLYFDLSHSLLTERQIRRCLPSGILAYAIAIVLFFSSIPFRSSLSAWMTALATYLVLYYFLSSENKNHPYHPSIFLRILAAFGRNSYPIYLLHGFWAWTFVRITQKLLIRLGIDAYSIVIFLMLFPIVLTLSYFSGWYFGRIVRRITGFPFKNGKISKP